MAEGAAGAAPAPGPITELLHAWSAGDTGARDRLIPLVYGELRRLASRRLRGERHAVTLQPTALVHETFLRLVGRRIDWQGRVHFFAVAAKAMRQVLVDHARRRRALKRGGGALLVSIGQAEGRPQRQLDLVALDESLEQLAALDPRQSEVVELRFFGGLSVEETAEVLRVSPATVKREWSVARAWLFRQMRRGEAEPRPV